MAKQEIQVASCLQFFSRPTFEMTHGLMTKIPRHTKGPEGSMNQVFEFKIAGISLISWLFRTSSTYFCFDYEYAWQFRSNSMVLLLRSLIINDISDDQQLMGLCSNATVKRNKMFSKKYFFHSWQKVGLLFLKHLRTYQLPKLPGPKKFTSSDQSQHISTFLTN